MTKLIAFAGPSRSGKGTAARVVAEECAKFGLTSLERQLSDNGKWSLARIFLSRIGRTEAVRWFEDLKRLPYVNVTMRHATSDLGPLGMVISEVPLQKFLQHGLQEGGRDIFGEDLWTDRIIPKKMLVPDDPGVVGSSLRISWEDGFFDDESGVEPTDVAIISDLRQPNEAQRVHDIDGLVVEMVRPEVDDQYRTGSDHVTERRLPVELSHYEVMNDGTLEELEDSIRLLFEVHLKPWIMDASRAL